MGKLPICGKPELNKDSCASSKDAQLQIRKRTTEVVTITHLLCNRITDTGQRSLYVDFSCFREPKRNVDNSIHVSDNNDNSSREILSKQWTFYWRFSRLACFYNRIIMHLVRGAFVMKKTLTFPYFVWYIAFQNAEKTSSPHACFVTHLTK